MSLTRKYTVILSIFISLSKNIFVILQRNLVNTPIMAITDVRKKGTVLKTLGDRVEVGVACKGDECSGCKASFLCSTNKDAIRLNCKAPEGTELKPGDEVNLVGRLRGWFSGWMLLAGWPCVAALLVVALGFRFGWSDVTTGSVCCNVIVIYYGILVLLKGKLDKRVEWEIEKTIN